MTEEEFREDLEKFISEIFNLERPNLPIKTGNLRNNAYRLEKTANGYKLYIDPAIAPYVKYLTADGSRKKKDYLHWNSIYADIYNALLSHYSDLLVDEGEEEEEK